MYEHTQRSGRLLLLFCLAGAGALAALALPAVRALPAGPRFTLAAAALAFVVGGLGFSSFTIRVGDGRLAWHFGPGLVRKSVPLGEIAAAEPATTSWVDGWGIHLTRRGWLYNVAGHNAVLVTMRDGKRFMLGTDEPAALIAAIRAASGTNA
jgi:hypothetical protein